MFIVDIYVQRCVKDNERIIDAQILHAEKENGFKIEESDNKIIIKFDFIAKNQGIVLKIFHTGIGDDILKKVGSFNDGRKISYNGHISSQKMVPYHSLMIFRFRKKTIAFFVFCLFYWLLHFLCLLFFFYLLMTTKR